MHKDRRILEIAGNLIENGNFSMAALAKEAHVSRATLYRRFKKKEIIEELVKVELSISSNELPIPEKLILSVRDLIGKKGLFIATIENIAENAGVAPITVYRAFGNREKLIEEAFTNIIDEDCFKPLDTSLPVDVALKPLIVSMLKHYSDYSGLVALLLTPAMEDFGPFQNFVDEQNKIRSLLLDYFTKIQDHGLIISDDVQIVVFSFIALIMADSDFFIKRNNKELTLRADKIMERFLKGFQAV